MNPKDQIIKSLEKATGENEIHLEIPEREGFGDFTSNIAMQLFAQIESLKTPLNTLKKPLNNETLKGVLTGHPERLKGVEGSQSSKTLSDSQKSDDLTVSDYDNRISDLKSPHKLAEKIVKELINDQDLMKVIGNIEIAGVGFINFHLKTDVLLSNLIQIEAQNENFGKSEILKGKKMVVEFAHPNTHKPFHIGHLRNITTGETMSRLMSFAGAEVVRVNYQGDVGLHIAKAIWGINQLGFSDPDDCIKRAGFLGKAYVAGNKAYEENETSKEEIHQINEKLYKKDDPKLNDLYKKTRQWSLDYFDYIYKRVGTKFDRLYFESEVADEGVKLAVDALEKGILEKSEGAVIFPGTKYDLHDRVFITSRGVPTYEGKDLGLAKLQFSEYNPDSLVHIVGPEQADYFKVLFKALEFIQPETKGREVHVPYGWVRLKEGKMSSRTGNVVLGDWLLEESKKKIIEKYKSDNGTAEMIAVAAVKYSFLRNGLNQEIAFDINESISLEGNSGPYLQYTFVRTQSVIAKSVSKIDLKKSSNSPLDTLSNKPLINYLNMDNEKMLSLLLNSEELSLLRYLCQFPGIISMTVKMYSPNLLCNYLYNLAQKFNTFYNKHKILVDDPPTLEFRLKLTEAVGIVLQNGLKLLGIETPEKM